MEDSLNRQEGDESGDIQRIRSELAAKIDEDEELQHLLEELASKNDQNGDTELVDYLLFSKTERWSGPLPPPELLGQYEGIQAGLADRIVSMTEREQQHHMSMQRAEQDAVSRLVSSDIIHTYLGTILGFIFAMAFLFVGGWLIVAGHWTSGLPIGLITPGILFILFAYRYSKIHARPTAELEEDEDA